MSLILEALRKSEAERRRGQVPELFDTPVTQPSATLAPASRTAPRLSPGLIAGGAAVAAVLVLGAWWSMRDEAHGAPQVDAPPVAMDTLDASPADASPRMPRPDPQPTFDPVTTPVATAAAVPATTTPASIAPAPSADPPPVSEPSTAARPLAAATPASATSTTASPAARTGGVPLPAPRVAAPTPVAAAVQPEAAPMPANETVREPAMLRLGDLVADERRQLPALKMSMHMWAPDRAQRFVILDGARMTEGDRVGEAVIEAITTDGAVLAWRGRQLKVPVR